MELILDDFYEMKVGEMIFPNTNVTYTRVPGGWVYDGYSGSCFIPFVEKEKDIPELRDTNMLDCEKIIK